MYCWNMERDGLYFVQKLLHYVLEIFSTTTHQHIHHSVIVNWKTVIQNNVKEKNRRKTTIFFVSGTAHSQRKLDPLVCNNEAMPAEEV